MKYKSRLLTIPGTVFIFIFMPSFFPQNQLKDLDISTTSHFTLKQLNILQVNMKIY